MHLFGINLHMPRSAASKTPGLDDARVLALPVCVALAVGVTLASPNWPLLLAQI